MKNSQEETDIEKLRELCRRWNRAASAAGWCGSEFHDDPEFVFSCLKARSDSQRDLIFRMVKEKQQCLN